MSFLKNIFFAPKETIDFYDDFQDIISYKKNYCKSILSYLDNATICFNDFLIRIKNIASNLEYITVSTEEQDIHNLLKSIHEGIIEKFEVSIKIFVELSNHFSQFKGNLEEEAQIYKNYKDAFINLKKEKVKLEKSKNKYHDLGKEMEYKIIQFVGNNFHFLNQINQSEFLMAELEQITFPPHISYEDYVKKLQSTNKLVGTYNQRQNKFFNYLPEVIAKDNVIYFNLINTCVNLLEDDEKKLKERINKIKDNKNFDKKENIRELKALADDYEKSKKEEKIINIEQYPTKIELSNCKNKKEFEIYYESVNIIKAYVDNAIFPNYDHDIEYKNYQITDLIKKLFAQKNDEINEDMKDNFFILIKEPSVYNAFFIILSKMRTNNSFSQKKSLINLLAKGFNIILNKSKDDIFENVKNCIILSQTYYYEGKDKQKIYIFEFIKNNKLLKSPKFWREFIQHLIEKDLGRFEKKTEKDLKKFGDVIFSNLITFGNNMKSLEIDKRIIVKIMDEFIEKYNYISENNIKTIFEMLLEEKEGEPINMNELDKLRKEYDVSLENEILENNDNNEDKKEKEEKKEEEEKKDDEEENKEEEEKKDEEKKEEKEDEEKKEEEKKEEKKDEEKKEEVSKIENEGGEEKESK